MTSHPFEWRFRETLLVCLVLLYGCTSDSAHPSGADDVDVADDPAAGEEAIAQVDAGEDTGTIEDLDDAGEDTGTIEDLDEPNLEYVRAYPLASSFSAPEGMVWRRAIIHLHSTHSHDACDGQPRIDGEYNAACIASLRQALCDTRIDFAYLTDHHDLMAETEFEDLLLHDPATDELIEVEGRPVANRIPCGEGLSVTLTAGMEQGNIMPLAFRGHLDPDVETRSALLRGQDAETMDLFREGGALAWMSHTEGQTTERVLELRLDGIEIYNLHANIDPEIRVEDLGLEALFADFLPFLLQDIPTSPDLALLAFLTDNNPSLETWARALEIGPMVGSAGTDAHENVLPRPMVDGERFDSYRRMMAWFSNYVLAEDESWAAFHEGLSRGRLFVGFDVLASPDGFDFHLSGGPTPRVEMGSTIPYASGLSLEVHVPALEEEGALGTEVRVLVYEVRDGRWELRNEGTGDLSDAIDGPGIFRVEVRMTPRHLVPYLDRVAHLGEREYPWIYSNAIRVTPQ